MEIVWCSLFSEVSLDICIGSSGSVWAEFSTGINGSMDAGVDAITYDSAELSATSIYQAIATHGAVIGAIVAEIRCDCGCAEIHFIS